MNEKVVVIYGGSFNPIHNGHIRFTEMVFEQYQDVEKIVFVPVNKTYNKPGLVDNAHRYNMLKIVCEKSDKYEVSDVEMRERQLYMYETLQILSDQYKGKTIWFMIGSDNLKEFTTWKHPEELVSKYKIIVSERENDRVEDIINSYDFLKENQSAFLRLDNTRQLNINSTEIRKRIKNNENIDNLVPDEIAKYIEDNNLYK